MTICKVRKHLAADKCQMTFTQLLHPFSSEPVVTRDCFVTRWNFYETFATEEDVRMSADGSCWKTPGVWLHAPITPSTQHFAPTSYCRQVRIPPSNSQCELQVNPYFFSRRTRFVYFDQSYSGDPMVHCPAQV